MVDVYDAGTTRGAGRDSIAGSADAGAQLDINTAVVTPTDRVRWGPIIAGLFVALSTLALLSVLGIAVAGTAWDPGDRARTFGIGAGVWGGVSMLIAFAIGGWIAARSAAVRGRNNGLLNGAMVWAVAIPLMLYMLAGTAMRTADTAVRTATDAASASVQAGAQVVSDDEAMQASASDRAEQAGQRVQGALVDARQAASDPQTQEQVAETTARTAWGTLVSLLLALGAAALGGYLGARRTSDHSVPGAAATA